MLEILEHTISDTILTLPILFITYMVLEYFERKSNNDDKIFFLLQKLGPFLGAFLGLLPQCGFSILAAMLFLQKNITLGTMLSVFIATSDEAIPVLISNPELASTIPVLLLLKFGIAIGVGYLTDHFFKQDIIRFEDMPEEDIDEEDYEETKAGSSCPCCYTQYPMIISAILRSVKIYIYIFLTTFVLTALLHWISADTLSKVLLTNSFMQPLVSALFGFIPNCAATVILCQLYVAKALSFASLVAGLITNAGLGILVLLEFKADKKDIVKTIGILFLTAVITGIILQMFI